MVIETVDLLELLFDGAVLVGSIKKKYDQNKDEIDQLLNYAKEVRKRKEKEKNDIKNKNFCSTSGVLHL